MAFEVRCEAAEGVAVLTIDNPPVNALHPDVAAALAAEAARLGADAHVRAVVLTAAGDHFMAGGDIRFFQTLDRDGAERYVLGIQEMQDCLARLPQPVVAAVNGAAIGGGCELAMACDIRIADERAVFAQPEVSLGIIPAAGGTQNLARLVPVGTAKRLLFTGDRIDAHEALRIGLVDAVVPAGTVLDRARELALRIARNAPLAVTAAKRAVDIGLQTSVRDGQRLEATLFASLVETTDFREGVAAFLEKREPTFKRA